jgi:hypothetical protein
LRKVDRLKICPPKTLTLIAAGLFPSLTFCGCLGDLVPSVIGAGKRGVEPLGLTAVATDNRN